MESFILFYEKCRLCLEQPGVLNMFEREDFPQDIYLCTGVRVHPSDNLPQKICDKCTKVITSAKELRVTANKNNIHLRALFDGEDDDEPRLQIDEGAITSTEVQTQSTNNKEQASASKQNLDTTELNSSSTKKTQIAVRKDLFENSTTVTSSTKSNSESNEPKYKKIKLEDDTILHECTQCSKRYSTHKKLYLHLRMHNKSVVCPLDACEKRFATKGDLEKHFRIHTGEKPFECSICGKGFAQRATLKAHRDSQHPKR